MCGRFAVSQPRFTRIEAVLETTFGDVTPRYNIAPTQQIAVIHQVDDTFVMTDMKWGLVPSWSKTPSTTYATFNARAETLAEKPVFRSAFKHRRCLIPASGFYEWKTEDKHKFPFYFTLESGDEMAFAGLWEQWTGADGAMLNTCTIIVGTANALVGEVHDRMACILRPDDFKDWLNPKENSNFLSAMLANPYPAALMKCWPVSTTVNSSRSEGHQLIVPLE
jgi:putative SOS response-associated peptidase YedK